VYAVCVRDVAFLAANAAKTYPHSINFSISGYNGYPDFIYILPLVTSNHKGIMNLHDYHIHTHHSCDASTSMHAACKKAAEIGLPEIGFTDHYDLKPEDPCFNYFNAEAYWSELRSVRRDLENDLTIRAGIEVGEGHLYAQGINATLSTYPWDYVLGSLHWVGEEIVFGSRYFRRSEEEAYRTYFHELLKLVQLGDFDILAHLDVVKRAGCSHYGAFEPRRYEREIRAVLAVLVQRGLALEVNSKTLRTPVGDISPPLLVLQWFREEGGVWITLGSDSHQAETIGAGIHEAVRLAQQAGFGGIAQFHHRTPSLQPF